MKKLFGIILLFVSVFSFGQNIHLATPKGSVVATDPTTGGFTTRSTILSLPAQEATTTALPSNNYNNGTSGFGATLTATSNGALTVDGIAVLLNDRVLVKNEATGSHNGIYTMTQLGDGSHPYILTRDPYFAIPLNLQAGSFVYIQQGTANVDNVFYQTTAGAITIGTTALSFVQLNENLANKNQVNGYPSLNQSGIVPLAETPRGVWIYLTCGGGGSSPNNGDTTLTIPALAHFTSYRLFREGLAQFPDTSGFLADSAVGQIVCTSNHPFVTGEHILVYAGYEQPLRSGAFISFNINSVANVVAWYDATDPTTVAIGSGGVDTLKDKTPNHNNLVQATSGNQPTYVASGGSNNQPYISFTANKFIQRTLTTPDTGAITTYELVQVPGNVNASRIFRNNAVGGANGIVSGTVFGSSSYSPYWTLYTYDGVGNGYSDLNTMLGDWMVLKSVMRGGGVGFLNVDKLGGWNFNLSLVPSGSPTTNYLNYIYYGDASAVFKMSEAIVIKGEPTATDDANIRQYLISKYSVPVRPMLFLFGDSHTAGNQSGTPTGNPYAFRSQWIKDSIGTPYTMMNMAVSGTVAYPIGGYAGITGRNLSDYYASFDSYISQNVNNVWVAYQYGTNDGNSPSNPTWVSNYTAEVQHVINLGVPKSHIIICSPPYNSNTTSYPYLAAAVPVIQGIASSLGVQFCDFYNDMKNLGPPYDCNASVNTGGDGIHGNDIIAYEMAKKFLTFIP